MSEEDANPSGMQWFVRRGSVVRGPFTSAKVRHFLLEGKLTVDDQVSADRQAWQPIATVAEVVPLQMRDHDEHLDVDRDVVRRRERARALRAMFVALGIVVGFVILVMSVGRQETVTVRDCNAPPTPGADFEGCALSGVDWVGANLGSLRAANVKLSGAHLSTADMHDADMRYAELSHADLSYARMQNVVLLGANLRNADLTNTDLSGADLSFADLGGARVGGARFSGAKLEGALWVDGQRCTVDSCPR